MKAAFELLEVLMLVAAVWIVICGLTVAAVRVNRFVLRIKLAGSINVRLGSPPMPASR